MSQLKIFQWTEEETALSLKVIHDYKTAKVMSGRDWETVRSKYHDLKDTFISNYPNSTDVFTKERMAAKIEKIKTAFRKAVDSGCRSGGGRGNFVAIDTKSFDFELNQSHKLHCKLFL